MSRLTNEHRLTVKPFATVPSLLDLPKIQREPASVSNVSSCSSIRGDVDLEEGCLVTKSVKYTHRVARLVNAVRFGDPVPIVSQKFQHDVPKILVTISLQEDLLNFMNIIPYTEFTLDDECNLVLRKSEGRAPGGPS